MSLLCPSSHNSVAYTVHEVAIFYKQNNRIWGGQPGVGRHRPKANLLPKANLCFQLMLNLSAHMEWLLIKDTFEHSLRLWRPLHIFLLDYLKVNMLNWVLKKWKFTESVSTRIWLKIDFSQIFVFLTPNWAC